MDTVRTTITLPVELYERLKISAYHQKRTLSDLVRDGISHVVSFQKVNSGTGIRNLIGKYTNKGKNIQFKRAVFYDHLIKKEMSA